MVVVYPGERRYLISDNVEALPLHELAGAPSLFGA